MYVHPVKSVGGKVRLPVHIHLLRPIRTGERDIEKEKDDTVNILALIRTTKRMNGDPSALIIALSAAGRRRLLHRM